MRVNSNLIALCQKIAHIYSLFEPHRTTQVIYRFNYHLERHKTI